MKKAVEEELALPKLEIGEDLEECVTNVFRCLGFEASKEKIIGRSGVEHEIDILAQKDLEGLTFKIGIECKNWEGKVGKKEVEGYVSRWLDTGLNMYVIIAKDFTEDAERFAKAWGVMTIKLGEKARKDNLEEITYMLLRKFSGLIIGIAKQPLINSILKSISEMSNELENLKKRLNMLANEVRKILI